MVDIDFVYLWVDGNDPKWIAKRNACIGEPSKHKKKNKRKKKKKTVDFTPAAELELGH